MSFDVFRKGETQIVCAPDCAPKGCFRTFCLAST